MFGKIGSTNYITNIYRTTMILHFIDKSHFGATKDQAASQSYI